MLITLTKPKYLLIFKKLLLGQDFNIFSFLLKKNKLTIVFKDLKNKVKNLCNMDYSLLLVYFNEKINHL